MKKVAFIIFMLAINIFSITAQDCSNYYLSEGTDNEPGIYQFGDYSIDYSGESQEVEIGIYGFFEGWSSNSQADQTYFSVNGSQPIAVADLSDFSTYVNGVYVSLNAASLNDEYLSNATTNWTSGTVKFIGEIDNITMTQFESGLLFSCIDTLEDITGCDYQFEGDDPGFQGYIITNAYPFGFSGEELEVKIGYFDYVSFEDQGADWPSDDGYFAVNGSEFVSVGTIYANQPYMIGDVAVTIDTTAIPDGYNVPDGMISGSIIFNGEIDLIVTHQVESGIKFICVNNIQDLGEECQDFTIVGNDPDFPGIYGGTDAAFPFDGSTQIIHMGIYGLFNNWQPGGQQSQTFFTINDGEPISLEHIIDNIPFESNGVNINMDMISLNDNYLSESSLSWTSGNIIFSGEIDLIVMSQFESGLLYSCTNSLTINNGCESYTADYLGFNTFPGIFILGGELPFGFDGENQIASLGIYGLYNWSDMSINFDQSEETLFAVNGSDPVSLEEIYLNQPYIIDDVEITVDTTGLNEDTTLYDFWEPSGTVIFNGPIDNIVLTPFESGLIFVCSEPIDEAGDCIDYTVEGNDPEFPGIYGGSDTTITFDGSYQMVTMGIYGVFNDWALNGQQNQTIFTFENGQSLSLKYIQENVPMLLGDLFIDMDLTSLNNEYLSQSTFDWTSATISFTGVIGEIVMTQYESGLLFSCTEPAFLDDCVDYTEWNNDPNTPGVWLIWDDYTLNFDGSNQEVSMGIYGQFNNWNLDDLGNAQFVHFVINDQNVPLVTIIENLPYTIDDIVIDLDTNDLSDQYPISDFWTSGTIVFSGEIESINMSFPESGILFSCSEPIVEEESDCIDYTEDNSDPNAPGIYLIGGDYIMDYDSTHQEVSIGVYGFFDWNNISSGQADQTFFSVNGGNSVSLETIFQDLPYFIGDIQIDVDTNSLSDDYPLAEYWASGTITFTGHIQEVTMTQFESGLIFSCSIPAEEECECDECICQIDADFSYINLGSYFSFVSSGTGTEYSWDFGDGNMSIEENPTHQFSSPNAYNVCMTNLNLTDTCSITICKSIEFMANTPEANIITPNNDGYDDQAKIHCGNVTVYDRNGIVVAELINQEYWNGTNGNGAALPMGEYILKCIDSDVIRKITVIR